MELQQKRKNKNNQKTLKKLQISIDLIEYSMLGGGCAN